MMLALTAALVLPLAAVDENREPVVPSERGKSAPAAADEELDWIDGATLPVEGCPFADADTHFARLPPRARAFVVPGTWSMGHCTAGMSFVFRTDSQKLKIRWDLSSSGLEMRNMARSGVSGIDLYEQQRDGAWRFIKVGIPAGQKGNVLEKSVCPMKKLYRVYLPLYNGLSKIEFGVEKGRRILPEPLSTVGRGGKPVVFYGGSFVQGASASRPGMHWVSQCGRFLGRPTVCMGFNGQGRMNIPEEADLLAGIDASAYCFACLGNMVQKSWKEDAEAFLTRLHRARPDVPIVFGGYHYIHQQTGEKWTFAEALERKLKTQDAELWKNLSVLPSALMCPPDFDGSVDGGHANDYGGRFIAQAFAKAVGDALEGGRPLRVLMIGNSFSESVLAELPKIARSEGGRLEIANLMIGGCSLKRHWENCEKSAADPKFRPYEIEVDWEGVRTCSETPLKRVAPHAHGNLQDLLRAEKWDVVTLQQASFDSWKPETYQPYADRLIGVVRELAPQAEIRVHQTWAYNAQDTDDQRRMHSGLVAAYRGLAARHGLKTIPTGEAVQRYREALPVTFRRLDAKAVGSFAKDVVPDLGGEPVGSFFWHTGRPWEKLDPKGDYRLRWDGCHLNPEGKYLQGLVWYAALFGGDPRGVAYAPAGLEPRRAAAMRDCAAAAAGPQGG